MKLSYKTSGIQLPHLEDLQGPCTKRLNALQIPVQRVFLHNVNYSTFLWKKYIKMCIPKQSQIQ